jgi:hypothetical protein
MITGLDPTSGPLDRSPDKGMAPRPDSLEGATIAFVANGLGRGSDLMDRLYEELCRDTTLAGTVKVVKSSVSIPPEPEDWARILSEATVAVTGFGG